MKLFSRPITATREDIDSLGHVSNIVWVGWIQDIAVAHWNVVTSPEERERYLWVVTRHEIDYRGELREGETVLAETWVEGEPRGARFDRLSRFTASNGSVKVEARTTWAMIERETGRPQRVHADIVRLFAEEAD